MFQYAAAMSVARQRGVPVKLDVAWFAEHDAHHGFELKRVFACPVEIATKDEVRAILGWHAIAGVHRLSSKKYPTLFRPKSLIVEPFFQFWPGSQIAPPNSYFSGYWQSEKYFTMVVDQVRNDFKFLPELSLENRNLANRIRAGNSVSLHVRRGDYLQEKKNTAIYATCSPDYYKFSIELISNRVSKPSFFIFSDDIGWAKNNLNIKYPCEYVDHNCGRESYSDMRLMSMCKHHIIANSTFSWWGAWLNSVSEKIVVAPKKWFLNETKTTDLFPREWIVV